MLLGEALDTGRKAEVGEDGIWLGMTRNAKEMAPRWRKPLTRNLGSVGCEKAMSRSPVSSNASRRRGESA